MASGDNEHRMLFDLRGRRRNVVKVVYATLAVLMGLSLFLVIGGFNIAELFNSNGDSVNAAEPYEEQAERLEAKLKRQPGDPNVLLALTRAHVSAGNASVEVDESNGTQTVTPEGVEQFELAYQTWSDYLKAADEPNPSLALLMSSALVTMAELAPTFGQADSRVQAAVDAQRIVAEQKPSVNSWTTLAFYTYFTGDTKAAEEARAEAKKLANTKAEREAIDTQLDETKKRAQGYLKEKERVEKAAKAQGGGQGAGQLENPLGIGGGGLGE